MAGDESGFRCGTDSELVRLRRAYHLSLRRSGLRFDLAADHHSAIHPH